MSPAGRIQLLGHTRLLGRQSVRKYASTAETVSNTASKSKESLSHSASKASQGLSRVTSSVGPAISGAAHGVNTMVEKVGGRTGRLISSVQTLIPPTMYYSRVGLELSKLVFKGQKMSPPDLAAFQRYSQPIVSAFRNPAGALSQTLTYTSVIMKDVSTQQMVTVGVIGLEVLGFFTVGEMIGKMKVVGYRGNSNYHGTVAPH